MRPTGATMPFRSWSAIASAAASSASSDRPAITLHADEVFGRCFVDVFSCKPFDADLLARVAVAHFGGSPTLTVLHR
jgi:hypothetical protein